MMAGRWGNVAFDYSGASVFVTGGTSGIGNAIAEAYAEAGAEVTITGTKASADDYDLDLGAFRYLQLDVEDRVNVDAVAAAMPRLDILINNAGTIFSRFGLDEMDPDVFERAMAVHLMSVQRLTVRSREKLAQSRLPGGASVIGIGSLGSLFGLEMIPGYGPAKTGLLGLTRMLAVAWGKHNIRVNVVIAGTTWTPLAAPVLSDPEFSIPHLARTPLGRHGVTDDISGVVLAVTSGVSSWLTGQTIAVDGGYSIMG